MKEEKLSRPSVEYEVPRELLLHRDQLMPPLEIGFERFEENELDVKFMMKHRAQGMEELCALCSVLVL